MIVSIDFEEGDPFFEAHVSGARKSSRESISALSQIITHATSVGERSIMIHDRATGPLSTLDSFHTGEAVARMGFNNIALVAHGPDNLSVLDNMEFLGLVSTNRGLNLKVFRDVPTASAWLLEQRPHSRSDAFSGPDTLVPEV